MRMVKSDREVLQHAAHDAINIFIRDVLIPRGLVDADEFHNDENILNAQVAVAQKVAEIWKESQLNQKA